jgi:hypothetical protein
MRSTLLLLLLGLFQGACRSLAPLVPRYIVTVTPINLVGAGHPGHCIAVDPTDAEGVWLWEPGPSGCSSRTTGPMIFRAQHATVAVPIGSGAVEVHFRLQLMSGPRDVELLIQDGGMRVAVSGVVVSTERRSDLDIPPAYGR